MCNQPMNEDKFICKANDFKIRPHSDSDSGSGLGRGGGRSSSGSGNAFCGNWRS